VIAYDTSVTDARHFMRRPENVLDLRRATVWYLNLARLIA
jgi:hypothetical protein